MTEDGAARHLDELASKYAGRPIRYFGDAIPARFAETEVPILCRIRPTHVVAVDATASGQHTWPEPWVAGTMSAAIASPARRTVADHPGRSPRPADERPICGVFTTMGSDGQPQSSLVWVDRRWRVRQREHDPRAPEGPQPARRPPGRACSSSIPTTRAGSSRSAATPSS